MDKLFEQKRHNYMEFGQIYFWTATINKWQKLLLEDQFKDIIVKSLEYLSCINKIDVFAFVIMPNHIHLIWRIKEPNGKETLQGSFLKYTAYEFKKILSAETLSKYAINSINKSFEFWQRDPMAIHLYTPNVMFQKLDYLHNNPTAKHWELANKPSNYQYSSAHFYEGNRTHYSFLKDLRLEI